MKQPAINPESMTNPNTAAIMVSPRSREVTTATLMMMIFFILLTPFSYVLFFSWYLSHLTVWHPEIAKGMPLPWSQISPEETSINDISKSIS
jgi:hypothetical protein